MNYRNFLNEVKMNNVSGAYLFKGIECYLMDKTLDALINNYLDSNQRLMNLADLKYSENLIKDIKANITMLPLMAEKKITVVRKANESIKALNDDDLLGELEKMPDASIIIFMDEDDSIKKTLKFYKYFKKTDHIVSFDKEKIEDLVKWTARKFNELGVEAGFAEARFLIDRLGFYSDESVNMYSLESEVEKLASYIGKGRLTRSTIENVVKENTIDNIFAMIDAINKKNTRVALNEYEKLLTNSEADIKTSYMIFRNVRLLLELKICDIEKKSEVEKKDLLKISPYEYKKLSSLAHSYNYKFLLKFMNELKDLDISLKNTSKDSTMMIKNLIYKMTEENMAQAKKA